MHGFNYLKNVSTLKLDSNKCVGCGMCTTVCPHGVFEVFTRKALVKDIDNCMECGACSINCPMEALSVSAGVGCASAIIKGWITGNEPSCGCGDGCC